MLSPWNVFDPFKVTPDACGNSVFRTSARILVPVNDMNPMAIADSGASHVILPQTASYDTKAAKPGQFACHHHTSQEQPRV